MGLRAKVLGALGFRIEGFRVWGFRVLGLRFLGFTVLDLWFRVRLWYTEVLTTGSMRYPERFRVSGTYIFPISSS